MGHSSIPGFHAQPRFIAEKTLGALAKWLRLLGFDTLYEQDDWNGRELGSEKQDRILLTRTKRIREKNRSRMLIFIESNHPFEQIKQVIQTFGIDQTDVRPFLRCIRCNTPTRKVDKTSLRGKVPDYIWEIHNTFQICDQ
jgi:uncharacterized protein with PIN domain